jgi:hypothetical protein
MYVTALSANTLSRPWPHPSLAAFMVGARLPRDRGFVGLWSQLQAVFRDEFLPRAHLKHRLRPLEQAVAPTVPGFSAGMADRPNNSKIHSSTSQPARPYACPHAMAGVIPHPTANRCGRTAADPPCSRPTTPRLYSPTDSRGTPQRWHTRNATAADVIV